MNSSIIQVRPYQQLDQDSIKVLISTIQREEFGIPIRVEDQPDLSDIPKFYQKGWKFLGRYRARRGRHNRIARYWKWTARAAKDVCQRRFPGKSKWGRSETFGDSIKLGKGKRSP